MNSNFAFLEKYWPDMAEIGHTAELYLYKDANACIFKLGLLSERIVSEIIRIENLSVPEGSSHADRIRILKHAGMLPQTIDDILYALRKARNDAVHAGLNSTSKAETLLRMAFSLSSWFMVVYGDWNFSTPEYVAPAQSEDDDVTRILQKQEHRIAELSERVEQICTDAEKTTSQDRIKKAEDASNHMELSLAEEQYLISEQIHMDVDLLSVVNYALQQNSINIIQAITIENNSDKQLENIDLRITSTPEFCQLYTKHIECVQAKGSLCLKGIHIVLDSEYLAGLTEKQTALLHVSLACEDKLLCQEDVEVTVLAFDEWHGYTIYPELLTAFITPNHPEVTRLTANAARFLDEWTGDPSLDAYQSKDPNRVLAQAGAVYSALQTENIIYSVPPASFGRIGQRVRLCDTVIQQKLGTCLDLSLLYASCLEAMGLHSLLILQKGHIFAGVWLEELSFPEAVQDDVSLITKRLADGVNEIAIVECTAVVAGKGMSFDKARKAAEMEISDASILECIIDVYRTRLSGISSLPLRIQTADGWHIDNSDIRQEISAAPKTIHGAIDVNEDMAAGTVTKKTQWERKLLDLGMRNTLINMRLSRTILPIMVSSLDELEDALADGSDFSVLPRPEDWRLSASNIGLDDLHELGGYEAIIQSEFKNKRLRTTYTESEYTKTIKGLYRAARAALEENGANTLYLALGLLKWYENPRSQKARYAPVVLLPIEMVRKSAAQGYVVRLRDDEPQMNITMLEKLKQDFGITVNGLDPLPLDEHGIDMRRVFTILRKSIMSEKRWDVLESAYLGIFSFSQFVMWNDIRNRSEDLAQNKIVRSLMDGKLAWAAEDMEIGDRVPEDDVYLPIPVDASQLYAIEAASKGESFVLHGPPGTGKSQTITALISNALAQGKSVLFVAEKMAALEVVQKRLSDVGIGPFCLELHSNKSKKKDVLEQLQQASEVTKKTSPEAYAVKAKQIAGLRKELDDYASKLHAKLPCGLSLFELINRYEEVKDAPDLKVFPPDYAEKTTAADLEAHITVIERMIAAAMAIGHPHDHPLQRVACKQYSQKIRFTLADDLNAYRSALVELQKTSSALTSALDMEVRGQFGSYQHLMGVAKEMTFWLDVPQAWAKADQIENYTAGVCDMAQHYINANEIAENLLTRWQETFLTIDARTALGELNQNDTKWALAKSLGANRIAKSMAIYSRVPVNKATLRQEIETLLRYQKEKELADGLFRMYGSDLGAMYTGATTDWKKIHQMAKLASESVSRMATIFNADDVRRAYGGDHSCAEMLRNYIAARDNLTAPMNALYELLDIVPEYTTDHWVEEELALCEDIESNADLLKEWITWRTIAEENRASGLDIVVDAYEAGMDHKDIIPAYKKVAYRTMAIYAIDQNSALNTFSGVVFNEKIEQFKRIDRELTALTKQEIFCRLAARVPNFAREAAQSSELGILQRAIRSGGRGLSIRKLFEQIPELLPRLCPCMLMSPISAAQYLDPNRKPFDLVVFDEASQLPTCKAVGALARGENAIIVGDPKQMPPTSFFSTNTVDEDNLEVEDLESILDDCLALNMPQTHLLWHYRSRHESLIAFSNSQFYENKLYTFPSVNDRAAKVKLVHVNGVFARGKSRTNQAEAEAIIEELKRRCHDPELSKYSVGVVTFNVSQQNLIDDLLTEACVNDGELEHWAYESAEPVFIKNLENVQGDERDVILFSIGYGPDENGKVYMNFGPLNREGGWRRLNVAVSRARCEMTVFATLTPDQINLSKTSAQGVAALKLFLEYAAGHELPQDENIVQRPSRESSGIVDSICRALAMNGYQTDRMVGQSEYKIDIGVIDPKDPDEYLLGILLDGDNYENAKTTRDREVAQVSVLNSLGWKILRVWTMDWWDNSKKEMDRILKCIQEAEEGCDPSKPETETAENSTEPENEPVTLFPQEPETVMEEDGLVAGVYRDAHPVYDPATASTPDNTPYSATVLANRFISPEDLITLRYDREITIAVNTVLEQEAPICEPLLMRRVVQSFGIARSGSRIQDKMLRLFAKMNLPYTKQAGVKVYWKYDQDPSSYTGFRASGEGDNKREAREVPLEEASNAICYVLGEQISLSDEDLVREGARLLGYTRMGNVVVALMNGGISRAVQQGRITKGKNEKWKLI